ncbi:NAD-dependent epimerase/dehydratase family protein [Deinococcus sp. 12RED42]|uniref:NAD-dependent epimerase/dehydratase family protein n=1 Tax=Deinococcus sp. 12RED42 TaxID=2745872 RepID=UPI001E2F37C8|nr:NAD-dependent epimerase/dehydratase family protein [Deinococcus sp. 12RED42]MCD0165490.1 NAD-dependent epimerase/dehydratase family protein [Deinococcus sp. 12RED42]
MDILILGGTQFVGRHIVLAFLAGGHRVSILTRGQSPDELPENVERLRGDRGEAGGLDALTGRRWDACVDVSGYTPAAVQASAAELRDRVGRYVFVSTVSVYAEPGRHPVREDDPLLPPAPADQTEVTGQSYGPLKVACEQIVQEVFGDRATILRPQIVAGPFDHTARYPYWLDRAAGGGGETLLPGDGEDHVQVIDARDLAAFTVRVVEQSVGGVFNVAGPRLSWAAFAGVLGVRQPVWVPADALEGLGLGFRELPLFIPESAEQAGLMDVDAARALAVGLTLRDPAVTARDTRAWSAGVDLNYALTPEREAQALAAWREEQAG